MTALESICGWLFTLVLTLSVIWDDVGNGSLSCMTSCTGFLNCAKTATSDSSPVLVTTHPPGSGSWTINSFSVDVDCTCIVGADPENSCLDGDVNVLMRSVSSNATAITIWVVCGGI